MAGQLPCLTRLPYRHKPRQDVALLPSRAVHGLLHITLKPCCDWHGHPIEAVWLRQEEWNASLRFYLCCQVRIHDSAVGGESGRIQQQAAHVLSAASGDTGCQHQGEGLAAGEKFPMCNGFLLYLHNL